MREIMTVAMFEFRWQLRRRGALLFWLVTMLFTMLGATRTADAAISLAAIQSRLLMLAAPVMMMGALARDQADGVLPLLRSTGVRASLYPLGKWLGLLGVQVVLLAGLWAVSSLEVWLQADRGVFMVYQFVFLAIVPATVVLYTAIGLTVEGLVGNQWRTYPAVLLIGLAAMLLDSPFTLAFGDHTIKTFYSRLLQQGWHLVWQRTGLFLLLSILLVGLLTVWWSALTERRGGTA